MSRLAAALRAARDAGVAPAFVPYLVAGDPTPEETLRCAVALARAGAHALELGIPWSDPVADGPANQKAMGRALAAGSTTAAAIELAGAAGRETGLSVVIMTYANPVYRMGLDRFVERAERAAVAGVLVTDLPLEEWGDLRLALGDSSIATVMLHAPTTPDARAAKLLAATTGFLYVVARMGVTGSGAATAGELSARLHRLKSPGINPRGIPLGVGFGLRTPEDLAALPPDVDAAIVGSAFSEAIARALAQGGAPADAVAETARWLRGTRVT